MLGGNVPAPLVREPGDEFLRVRRLWRSIAAPRADLEALLPILYLRGMSTGDFQEALATLLGKDAPNLSPAVITRLTAEWQAEYDASSRSATSRRGAPVILTESN